MDQITVDSSAIRTVAGTVSSSVGELETAATLVGSCAGAAADTPASGACEAATRAAVRTAHSLHQTMTTLSSQLNTAAANYEQANQSSTIGCVAGSQPDGG